MKERFNPDSVHSRGAPNHIQSDLRRLLQLKCGPRIQRGQDILRSEVSRFWPIIFLWKSKFFKEKINLTPPISFKFLIWKFHTVFSAIFRIYFSLNSKNSEYPLIYKNTCDIEQKQKALLKDQSKQNLADFTSSQLATDQYSKELSHRYINVFKLLTTCDFELIFGAKKLFRPIAGIQDHAHQALKKSNLDHRFQSIRGSTKHSALQWPFIFINKGIRGIEKAEKPDRTPQYTKKLERFCPQLSFPPNKCALKPSIIFFSLC